MTHTPDCTCITSITLPVGVEPEDMPPSFYGVVHCSMHKAAPKLLEACKAVIDEQTAGMPDRIISPELEQSLRAALAKAEAPQ